MNKTLIGVLASRDAPLRNDALARALDTLAAEHSGDSGWERYAFAFSGGTYQRIIEGRDEAIRPVQDETWRWLHEICGVLRLPEGRQHGGGILLGCLIAQGMIQLLFPFFSPATSHWLHPENLALLRLADLLSVSTFMNAGSVVEWGSVSAVRAIDGRATSWPPAIVLEGTGCVIPVRSTQTTRGPQIGPLHIALPPQQSPTSIGADDPDSMRPVIALIAHDEMKESMRRFVIDHEAVLGKQFTRILCTGTTGQIVSEAAPSVAPNVHRYRSGPRGGDLEIATEVLYGACHVVVFFVDPLRPHPHTDDIRSIFSACMRQDQVRMFSNERQARQWFRERFGDEDRQRA